MDRIRKDPRCLELLGDGKRIIAFVTASDFGLVETLAERCAALILDEFGVRHVRLKLSKPGAVRGARAVGVMIERSRG